jgi:hypothetical protein
LFLRFYVYYNTDDTAPTSSLTSHCSWGGLWVQGMRTIVMVKHGDSTTIQVGDSGADSTTQNMA